MKKAITLLCAVFVLLNIATAQIPDADGDGVSDQNDACPNTAGTKANKGCPDTKATTTTSKPATTQNVTYITQSNFDDILNTIYTNNVQNKIDAEKFVINQEYSTGFRNTGAGATFPVKAKFISAKAVVINAPMATNKNELETIKDILNNLFKNSVACNLLMKNVNLTLTAATNSYSDVYVENDFGITYTLAYDSKSQQVLFTYTKLMMDNKKLIADELLTTEPTKQKPNKQATKQPIKTKTATPIIKEITLDALILIANTAATKNKKEPFKKLKTSKNGNIEVMEEGTNKECLYKVKGCYAVAINNESDEIIIQVAESSIMEFAEDKESPIYDLSNKLGSAYKEIFREGGDITSMYKNLSISQAMIEKDVIDCSYVIFIRPSKK